VDLEALFEAAEQRWLANWQEGPTRRRWESVPLQVGDQAPDFEVLDSTGRPRSLSEFWRDRPALVMFWRHFGCGCGVGRAERLVDEYEQLLVAGANVVVVGQGEPERAAWYKERYSVPCPILCDPDERMYRAYGLLECSPWLLLGEPKPGPEHFEELILQHRTKDLRVADNPYLLPGEFVVDTLGRFILTYRYQYCDNYPDLETLVDSIQEAAGGQSTPISLPSDNV
jgi:peroxiredoxin